jgi:hypothetical protein
MSNKKFTALLMAFTAMSFFQPSHSFAQKAFSPKIKTPNTNQDLINDKGVSPSEPQDITVETPDERESKKYFGSNNSSPTSAAPRKLQQHGLGIGIGETFLLGNYSKYGKDKITADLFYSYAASYSFDLLVNAHMSEHEDKRERMKVMGLTSSIKGRFVEYDNFSPYFLGGLGFYAPKSKRMVGPDNKWSTQKVTFGLNFGGGLDLRLNDNYVVGLLGQMHWPFKVEQDGGPDVKGYYFKLLITGMYLF